jgi:hypothetical protein
VTTDWLVGAASRIGSVHVRDGMPIQDAYRTWNQGDCAVIAVADGHGHAAHFRSGRGSRLAVDLAVEVLVGRLLTSPGAGHGPGGERLGVEAGALIVQRWTQCVLGDIEQHPFSPAEVNMLSGGSDLDLLRAYGSTFVAMALTRTTLTVLQLGDGDAVVSMRDGRIFRPLPEDADLAGSRTTSLCQPDPLRSLRCTSIDLTAEPVTLGFVCTDGFGSSRVDPNWPQQVATELGERVSAHGIGWVSDRLEGWLEEPALYGGDDTTLAVVAASAA